MKARLVVSAAALAVLGAREARAEDAGADASELAKEIEVTFGRVGEQLATHACDEACRALVSMRRAADKLCALEPGPRCDRARVRCQEAAQQVRDACPDCAITTAPPVHEPATERGATVATAPRAEERRGCASCATAKATDVSGDLAVAALSLLGILGLQRRRSARDQTRSAP